jgi:hypothetical protein
MQFYLGICCGVVHSTKTGGEKELEGTSAQAPRVPPRQLHCSGCLQSGQDTLFDNQRVMHCKKEAKERGGGGAFEVRRWKEVAVCAPVQYLLVEFMGARESQHHIASGKRFDANHACGSLSRIWRCCCILVLPPGAFGTVARQLASSK